MPQIAIRVEKENGLDSLPFDDDGRDEMGKEVLRKLDPPVAP